MTQRGYCECGCGQKTRLAPQTNRKRGWVAGEPIRFVTGHNTRNPMPYRIDAATGCWPWTAACDKDGYGIWARDGKKGAAHRLMYERDRGPIPPDHDLHHTCRNPSCVNPDHLEPMTRVAHLQTRDMPRGERHHQALLTERKVYEIRGLFDAGWIRRDIADAYGMALSTVRKIGSRELWRHLPETV